MLASAEGKGSKEDNFILRRTLYVNDQLHVIAHLYILARMRRKEGTERTARTGLLGKDC